MIYLKLNELMNKCVYREARNKPHATLAPAFLVVLLSSCPHVKSRKKIKKHELHPGLVCRNLNE